MGLCRSILFWPATRWLLIGWVIFLLCLPGSALPGNPLLERIHFDKWVHVFLFACLSLAWCVWVYQTCKPSNWLSYIFWVLILGILLGVLLEFVQDRWIPLRSFDWMDMVADTVGMLTGWLVSRPFRYT